NRLIRVSYGPFQLGDLPAGAVEEIRTRALREQIGERIAAIAGADFSGPISERDVDQQLAPSSPRHPEARAKRASKGDGPGADVRKWEGRGRASFPPSLASRAMASKPGAPKRDSAKAGEGRLRRPPPDDGERREGGGKRPRDRHRNWKRR